MRRRKQFIVDKKFQYWFIAKNLLFLVFFIISLVVILFLWEKNQYKQGLLLRLPSNEQIAQWAEENNFRSDSVEYAYQFYIQAKHYTFFGLLWKPITIILFINIFIIILVNIYFSHKIAGPIYKLKKTLREKLEGEIIKPIVLRKGDAFHDLADIINQVLNLKK